MAGVSLQEVAAGMGGRAPRKMTRVIACAASSLPYRGLATLTAYVGRPFCSSRSYNSRTDSPNSSATVRNVSSPR